MHQGQDRDLLSVQAGGREVVGLTAEIVVTTVEKGMLGADEGAEVEIENKLWLCRLLILYLLYHEDHMESVLLPI
jgi:hypothetical protein